MRKGISWIAIVAVLAQGPAAVGAAGTASRTGQSGLCRTPVALPQLGPESWNQKQPPPRPMPGKPARPEARGDADDGGAGRDMVVTAKRTTAPAMESASPVTVVSEETTDSGPSPIPVPPSLPPSPPPPPPVAGGDSPPSAPPPPTVDKVMPGETGGYPDHMPPPPRPQPYPQAGILTAGEHDDLLNPELYAAYQRRSNLGQELPGLPRLDTARVLTVAVKDGQGRPVPFAPVEVACSDGGTLLLATTADGTVSLFPDVDKLGKKVRVRTGGSEWRDVAIASGQGGQRVDFTVARQAQAVSKLDLMLVIDCTGSMSDEIRYLQTELGSILSQLRSRHPGVDIRVGFVFYRDLGDDYVTQTLPLTRDFAAAQGALSQQYATGGGDYPEAMDQALIRAAGQDWRGDAAKTMLLVADAPPHDENVGLSWQASEVLRHQRVQIVPVAASGVADKAEYVMRAMAALTQSRYTFLTDDSGVGNPHAAPAIDCYLVTRLNSLLLRVIDSQLSGRRVEPGEQEVIRTVGTYDHGKCVIPPGGLRDQ